MSGKLELLVDENAILGEGPTWDEKAQSLYWLDIMGKQLHIFEYAKGSNRTIELEQMPGTIVPRKSGGAVIALQNGFYFMNLETGQLEPITDPESHLPHNRFNDGKCDPKGRFWAGTIHLEGKEHTCALYCLDTNLEVDRKISEVTNSNGLAWSPDESTFYFIDTPTLKVVAYDYDAKTGSITNPRNIIAFPEDEGFPDGMTIDEEGMLWIAHYSGSKVSRWDPNNGQQLTTISVPAKHVTSCTFGGPDLDELYITTAKQDDTDMNEFPHAGGLFRIKPGVKGMPAVPFNG
ncbi:SMP-30/gluconolaconase/LRE domain protein [Bacillus sp. FJAT-27916]|uniref:SMP-30/gluconolactonase/LRE family protein n=1 Tax=Bacillus sp. FJAT-27916 TaxID=1679169 RepID=UPI000671572A|nr:SMP-30/gluconolactonase/LRE family protein [Bacillus sp. FJAT-27916]KMY43204.1 SMP-30/gluconolaconase/LRE domain protein [Bacillus sp. FJAT-27916]